MSASTFDPHQVAIVPTAERPAPLARCLAEIAGRAESYAGGYVQTGDRVVSSYPGAIVLGLQGDGRYAYAFGHLGDAEDFRADAMIVCQSFGIDCGWTVHPNRFGGATVLLELEAVIS